MKTQFTAFINSLDDSQNEPLLKIAIFRSGTLYLTDKYTALKIPVAAIGDDLEFTDNECYALKELSEALENSKPFEAIGAYDEDENEVLIYETLDVLQIPSNYFSFTDFDKPVYGGAPAVINPARLLSITCLLWQCDTLKIYNGYRLEVETKSGGRLSHAPLSFTATKGEHTINAILMPCMGDV